MTTVGDKREFETLEALYSGDSNVAVVLYNQAGDILAGREALVKLLSSDEGTVAQPVHLSDLHPPQILRTLLDPSRPAVQRHEMNLSPKDGPVVPVLARFLRIQHQGEPTLVVVYEDRRPVEEMREELQALRQGVNYERQYTEQEAEFLRVLLTNTMETIQLGILLQDVDNGLIAYANEGFCRLSGIPIESIQSYYFKDLFVDFPELSANLRNYSEHIRECLLRNEPPPPPAHWEVEFPSGRKCIETYGRPIVVRGHPAPYIMLIIEDHTERQRQQVQLAQSEKLAAIGQLAAGIAHEMRNPLTTIYNALYDLSEIIVDPTPEVAEDIEISMEEIKRTQDIINNLLDFARETERTDGRSKLNDVLQRTIRLVQHDLGNKQISLAWQLGPDAEVAINNNALKQIIINLITNAAQAMSEGGTLTLTTQLRDGPVPARPANFSESQLDGTTYYATSGGQASRVYEVKSAKNHVLLEISDTGSGIPDSILHNIFNPFFTTKPPGSGTGLGLSIVHSLVSDAGGAISVRTKLGSGTTFVVALPIANEDEH